MDEEHIYFKKRNINNATHSVLQSFVRFNGIWGLIIVTAHVNLLKTKRRLL